MSKRKSIQFTEEAYREIVQAAEACGFRVSRGCASELAKFIEAASTEYSVRHGNKPTERVVGATKSHKNSLDIRHPVGV